MDATCGASVTPGQSLDHVASGGQGHEILYDILDVDNLLTPFARFWVLGLNLTFTGPLSTLYRLHRARRDPELGTLP